MKRMMIGRILPILILVTAIVTIHDASYAQRRREMRREERREVRRERRREAVIAALPRENVRVVIGGREYFYARGVYYRSGPRGFVTIAGPVGLRVRILPEGYRTVVFAGGPLFLYWGTYYRYDADAKEYVVVTPPPAAEGKAPPSPTLDTVELVDGTSMQGTYMGGTNSIVQMQTDAGVKEIPIEQIVSITFAPPPPAQ